MLPSCLTRIVDIASALSGNLRFMPEMLYFITYILSVSTPPRIAAWLGVPWAVGPWCHASFTKVHKGRSSAFLVDIVRPIYKARSF